MDADVVVVGAGLAGLVATAELATAGPRDGRAPDRGPRPRAGEPVHQGPAGDGDPNARRHRGDRLIRTAAPHRILDPAAGPLIAVRLHVLTRKTLGGVQTDLACRFPPDDHRAAG